MILLSIQGPSGELREAKFQGVFSADSLPPAKGHILYCQPEVLVLAVPTRGEYR